MKYKYYLNEDCHALRVNDSETTAYLGQLIISPTIDHWQDPNVDPCIIFIVDKSVYILYGEAFELVGEICNFITLDSLGIERTKGFVGTKESLRGWVLEAVTFDKHIRPGSTQFRDIELVINSYLDGIGNVALISLMKGIKPKIELKGGIG